MKGSLALCKAAFLYKFEQIFLPLKIYNSVLFFNKNVILLNLLFGATKRSRRISKNKTLCLYGLFLIQRVHGYHKFVYLPVLSVSYHESVAPSVPNPVVKAPITAAAVRAVDYAVAIRFNRRISVMTNSIFVAKPFQLPIKAAFVYRM